MTNADPQPVDLTAFLATAELAILQAPDGTGREASEPLIAAGCHYAPRLLAAVKAALAEADRWAALAPTDDWGESMHGTVLADAGRSLRETITRVLLGEGG